MIILAFIGLLCNHANNVNSKVQFNYVQLMYQKNYGSSNNKLKQLCQNQIVVHSGFDFGLR